MTEPGLEPTTSGLEKYDFFLIFSRESSHCTLQADKSFEPLPIILSEILHLQNCRMHNSKKVNNSKNII